MKIAYVFDDSLDRPDGVQQAVLTTGEWMRANGHEVHYLVGRTDRDDIENVHSLAKSLSVKFNGNSMSTPLPASTSKLKAFLSEQQFDVLHVQMPYSPFFAAKVIKLAPKNTKIIGTFHILPYTRFSSLATKQLGRMLKKSLKRFHHFISVSKPAAEFARATFGIHSIVLPNPVHVAQFKKARVKAWPKPRRIVFLGRLEERKGIIELLLAYKQLLENNPNLKSTTELLIGGKGPLKVKVHKIVQSFPRGANVSILGFVPELEKAVLFANAYITALPSTSGESFGIVLVEAMASGSRLIIAGNNPGYASVLGEKPETLVNPRNVDEFEQRLAWGLHDTKETKELTNWLHNEAERYDIETVGQELLKLYAS